MRRFLDRRPENREIRMNKLLMTSLLMVLSGIAAAEPSGRMRVLEEGHELAAEALQLPTSLNGGLGIHACSTCPNRSMQLSVDTRLMIGSTEVSLATLRDFLNANPSAMVLVVNATGKNVVLRIVASGTVQQ
jgi:hypothetical protein